jgi:hypothetical protein
MELSVLSSHVFVRFVGFLPELFCFVPFRSMSFAVLFAISDMFKQSVLWATGRFTDHLIHFNLLSCCNATEESFLSLCPCK